MIREFNKHRPSIAETCYIDPSAEVIGDVEIAANSSVWPLVAIRGDVNIIRIGEDSNIQDGSVLHGSHISEFNPAGAELHVGNQVTVGHKVLLHGCRIGNQCLIGMGSIVMDRVIVEDQVMLGAGSLVTPGKILESGYLYLGNPARRVRALNEREKESLIYTAGYYIKLHQQYD